MYLYERPVARPRSVAAPDRWRWSHLCGLDAPKRAGTLVLYAKPLDFTEKKLTWSFDTPEGPTEYETALHAHLAKKKLVPATGTTYKVMTSSADIARLASDTFENLVLIVHSAANGPGIAVVTRGNGDWIKDDVVGRVLAPLAYNKVSVLGCDAVANKFAPNLAKRLPKGSTVVGHKGGDFIIMRHFDPDKKVAGRLALTRVSSNLNLKSFKGGQ